MKEIERFKKEILDQYDRLSRESDFKFSCHKDLTCFNECCMDVNIFLTPYDILRLKNNLGITSGEFLKEYTISPFDKNLKYPVILLKMRDDENKGCPFVTDEGCGVYPDRPWSCRMYPIGLASPKEEDDHSDKEFFFLLKDEICDGHNEVKKWTVAGWMEDQGIAEYEMMGKHFKDLTLHRFFMEGRELPPEKMEMFFTACYNLDKFREFLFQSSFFEKFEVDDETKNRIEKDDVELLLFGYNWLRFALFGEKTMTVKKNIIDDKKKSLEERGKL
jgi:Fe-S-cluster containining protein